MGDPALGAKIYFIDLLHFSPLSVSVSVCASVSGSASLPDFLTTSATQKLQKTAAVVTN